MKRDAIERRWRNNVAGKARSTKTTDTLSEIVGLNQLLRVLNKTPKELQNEIRDAAGEIASDLVSGAKQMAHTPLQLMAANALKVKRDRVPIVRVPKSILRGTTRGTDIFYGAEFGGQARPRTQQFLAHRGKRGYFLYPYARSHGRQFAERWAKAVDDATKNWDYKPGPMA